MSDRLSVTNTEERRIFKAVSVLGRNWHSFSNEKGNSFFPKKHFDSLTLLDKMLIK